MVILGNDAVLAARPATAVQLAHACHRVGYDAAVPASWGDELVAGESVRQVRARGAGASILCACPHVEARLLAPGPDLAPLLVGVVAPPVAAARYVRRLYGDRPVHVTYVGACPSARSDAASDAPAIDAALSPAEFLQSLADGGVRLDEQPTVYDSVIPPDRRRFCSLPGGAPAPSCLWDGKENAHTLVEIAGEDYRAELAQHLLAQRRAVVDLAPRLGCACSGAAAAAAHSAARTIVAATEPPRANGPVVEPPPGLELQRVIVAPRVASRTPSSVTPAAPMPSVAPEPRPQQQQQQQEQQRPQPEPPQAKQTPPAARTDAPPPSPPPASSAAAGATPPEGGAAIPSRKKLTPSGIFRAYTGQVPRTRDAEGKPLPRAYAAHRRPTPGSNAVVGGGSGAPDTAARGIADQEPTPPPSPAPVDPAAAAAAASAPNESAAERGTVADAPAERKETTAAAATTTPPPPADATSASAAASTTAPRGTSARPTAAQPASSKPSVAGPAAAPLPPRRSAFAFLTSDDDDGGGSSPAAATTASDTAATDAHATEPPVTSAGAAGAPPTTSDAPPPTPGVLPVLVANPRRMPAVPPKAPIDVRQRLVDPFGEVRLPRRRRRRGLSLAVAGATVLALAAAAAAITARGGRIQIGGIGIGGGRPRAGGIAPSTAATAATPAPPLPADSTPPRDSLAAPSSDSPADTAARSDSTAAVAGDSTAGASIAGGAAGVAHDSAMARAAASDSASAASRTQRAAGSRRAGGAKGAPPAADSAAKEPRGIARFLPGRTIFSPRGGTRTAPRGATPPATTSDPNAASGAAPTAAEREAIQREIEQRRARIDSITRRLDSLRAIKATKPG